MGGITSQDTSGSANAAQDSAANDAEQTGRPRTATTTAEIDSTIIHPGSVKINVKGAFIVEQDSATPVGQGFNGGRGSPDHHQPKDIRLPNHTAVVSHIAVDVS
jgi:type II pantothenate kinase